MTVESPVIRKRTGVLNSEGTQFRKGQSGNPFGRPQGIVHYAQDRTNGGRDMVDFMADVLKVEGQFQGARIPLQIRMEAASWLMDRCFGRPAQVTDIRVDVEQRVLTLAAEMGIDPQEAATEMTRVIEANKGS